MMLFVSEWLKCFKREPIDYLLERLSPKTLETLRWLKDLEFLKTILEVDGLLDGHDCNYRNTLF